MDIYGWNNYMKFYIANIWTFKFNMKIRHGQNLENYNTK